MTKISKFTNNVRQDTPRLVVMFGWAGDGSESFQWGIVGKIPLLTLLGCIVRVQGELSFRSPDECDQMALVVTWNEQTRKCEWYVHPDIPVDPLVGMLETIKEAILQSLLARRAANQKVVLGADGQPYRK